MSWVQTLGMISGQHLDLTKPSAARMYDYYLGGKDNFVVDRVAADQMMKAAPESKQAVLANRAFLVRAVTYLAREAGIRQFIDIGSGLPTQQNVHEVAQHTAEDSRVVYIDNDPVVLVHGQALLATNDTTRFIQGDLREPQQILTHPDLTALIDFREPMAILLVAVLHFLPDTTAAAEIIARLRAVMTPGSYLVISHITDHPSTRAIQEIMRASGAPLWYPRTRAEIGGFFDGFELVEPGLTSVGQWRPATAGPNVTHISAGPAEEVAWCDGGVARYKGWL